MPSSHLILCHPLLLLPSIPPSIRVFSNESTLRMRWPKYWSFSFSVIPSKEHPGLISFTMDELDLLAIQGILKSLLQHHSSKASILWYSAFFIVQLLHPYMTTGKSIALTRRTFVDKKAESLIAISKENNLFKNLLFWHLILEQFLCARHQAELWSSSSPTANKRRYVLHHGREEENDKEDDGYFLKHSFWKPLDKLFLVSKIS